MILYPAIELKGGKCVILHHGDMTQGTIYNDDPQAQALDFARAGFNWLHIVDLDGAEHGAPANHHAVRNILKTIDIPVQLGGGIRNLGQIEHWLGAGVSRVILGTTAVRNPELVREACAKFPDQIMVSIDARRGWVTVEGWTHDSNIEVEELLTHFEDAGVAGIIYTDIDRDGTGMGVDIDGTVKLAASSSIPVIASGGIGSLDDIAAVKTASAQGIQGLVIGKSLYDGKFTPQEALQMAAQ